MGTPVIVRVNGKEMEVAEGTTVAGLLERLEIGRERTAVERNREIVPRGRHAETVLADGDVLEIVTAVGGG
jgi:sulfur carrier protein